MMRFCRSLLTSVREAPMSRKPLALVFYLTLFALFIPSVGLGQSVNEPQGDPGFLPQAEDGRTLNLNFETGDLTDWTATGDAWKDQPVKGPISPDRPFGAGKKSQHTGEYWLGGYEIHRDPPQGTLTSVPFKVTANWASFLLGGGAHPETRVELVRNDTQQVFFKISGKNQEEMLPVIVNLTAHAGQEIFIRIVDEHSGGWGHVNFDDFRLHKQRPRFQLTGLTPASLVQLGDPYPFQDLAGEEAAAKMIVPDGFQVQLAAQEPEVMQPIAMAYDDRGRLWVAEAYEYPRRAEPGKGRDRILIFEDTNLDGKFDSRKVFIEGLNLVSGLQVGFGGVWVGAAPYLMFIPNRDGDDVPDEVDPIHAERTPLNQHVSFPQDVPKGATVLLDGWGWHDTHETLNAFIWGPDGWLYGCHGVFTHSKIGQPGTPDDQRTPLNAGVWRYHPTRHQFEVYAHGSSNPWGVDFNELGDAFITACVIPHLYHVIPGARYQRQAGQHFNPHTYDDIKTIARHRHFIGGQWNNDDRARSNDLGGGHAHAGAMIYQGGRRGTQAPEWEILNKYASEPGWNLSRRAADQGWPAEYFGKLFMNNIHGRRMNVDQLIPTGSGYAGDRFPDFLLTRDKWSQMLYMTYGPDGQVHVIDWYDMNQCHRNEVDIHDRSNGRIFRISYGDAQPVQVNLQQLENEELLQLALFAENEWYARHARRLLYERRFLTENPSQQREAFHNLVQSIQPAQLQEVRQRVRYVTLVNSLELSIASGLDVPAPQVRAAAIQAYISASRPQHQENTDRVVRAISKPELLDSPIVRRAIASATMQLSLEARWEVLENLTRYAADAHDHNLPLLYWYALEPLADADPQRALALAMSAGENIPLLRDFMVRRLGSGKLEEALQLLVTGLADTQSDDVRLTFLKGIRGALLGRGKVEPPATWEPLYTRLTQPETTAANFDVYLYALGVGARFGNGEAAKRLDAIVVDEAGAFEERKVAFAFLIENDHPRLPEVISQLLTGSTLRGEALRAAARVQQPTIAAAIVASYKILSPDEQTDARNTLASRVSYARELLKAIEIGSIPRGDLSADLIRQLRNLEDAHITELLNKVWGVVRESDGDRKQLIAAYTSRLQQSDLSQADVHLGRAIFAKTCQQCHTLFGEGGKVGPDITGANRRDLNYLLSNILDPSAVMAKEYQPSVFVLDSGRVITGIVKEETATLLTVQTANEVLQIPVAEIEARKASDKSMMPDDLLKTLNDREVEGLIAYLASPQQVSMAATPDNLNRLFNGQTLAGWRATREVDHPLWSVENGEIVGKSTGLRHNSFLVSDLQLGNFEFRCEVKLTPNNGNSGIQFRSLPLPGGEMRGYQADIGAGWWGKLYEESARGLLVNQDKSELVKSDDWNEYIIRAVGDRVQLFLNGVQVADFVDPQGAKAGQIALQLHSGGPMEVRFRNLSVHLLEPVPPFVTQGIPAGQWPRSETPAGETKITWKRIQLDDLFRSEGVTIADFDNDGHMDIATGSVWYPLHSPFPSRPSKSAAEESLSGESASQELSLKLGGGQFVQPQAIPIIDPPEEFNPKGYSNTFCNFPQDLNGDGWMDLVVVDFPGKPTWWFENPGPNGQGQAWKRHMITPVTNNESPQLLDLTGDGIPELLCGFDQKIMGFATRRALPSEEWKINIIAGPGAPGTDRFSHGIGAGDLSGNGRNDIVITEGWWEAPDDYSTETPWIWHPAPFGPACSHIYVFDFDGDGDNDVLTASAHRYGIWWHENKGNNQWETHLIDESFAQTHAVVLADINGNGLPDFLTGKRHWAHGGNDPGESDPAVLYWFELTRENGTAKWIRHQIDDNSGVGTQFDVADINGDGLLDIAVSNKKGTFIFLQQRN